MDFPIADRTAARTLGAVLRKLDYSEDGIGGLLGEEAFETGQRDAPVHLRRLPATKLATAVQLLFLQLPASRDDAARAFGKAGLDALERTGFVRIDSGFDSGNGTSENSRCITASVSSVEPSLMIMIS